ncbi:MAG: DEAD/DEAH box helicase, partial [Shimia sp.]|nr:DEAD/DEAH box helicase [Shimia sp.]
MPIESSLPALVQALKTSGRAVLQAPPGAGKTTKVPLALLAQANLPGKIIMLEPRRVAARASAERMAQMLGEEVGQTVGYRVRGGSKTSPSTRIEVVTEGILTRMLQSDPELPGISAILFDEFHERALTADLGLALSLEARDTLRPDLWLLVMSATLDAAPVAKLLGDAPMITSEGRAFPVDTRFLEKPRGSGADRFDRLCADTADLVRKALAETEGGVLFFLPGAGEIRRTSDLL